VKRAVVGAAEIEIATEPPVDRCGCLVSFDGLRVTTAEMEHVPTRANAEREGGIIADPFRQRLRGPRQPRCAGKIYAREPHDLVVKLLDGARIMQPGSATQEILSRSLGRQLRDLVQPVRLFGSARHYSHEP
jgi:hypothetical protein